MNKFEVLSGKWINFPNYRGYGDEYDLSSIKISSIVYFAAYKKDDKYCLVFHISSDNSTVQNIYYNSIEYDQYIKDLTFFKDLLHKQ